LADLDIFGLYLDAIALQVRSTGKVTSIPVLSSVDVSCFRSRSIPNFRSPDIALARNVRFSLVHPAPATA